MNLIEQIAITSPWWLKPDWDKNDRDIVFALKSGLKMRHIEHFRVKFPSVEIIKGPRQIGKTTEIKMIVRELINKGQNPKSIGCFTGDIISRHRDLFEILKAFSQHLELNNIKKGNFFIDEISSVRDWQKAVKAFVDAGLGKNVHLVVTGSSSIELRKGYERMPGRRNGGKDYLFLPVNFGKFCSMVNPGKDIQKIKFREIVESKNSFEKFRNAVSSETAFYKKHFMDYIKIGGFPRSISDFIKHKKISADTLLIYQAVLFSEFEKYKKSITTLMQVMGEIARSLTSAVSYNAIMKNIEIASANTVKEYIEMLCLAYLGIQVSCVDISKKRGFNRKDKKIYLIDPVIFKVLEEKLKIAIPCESGLSENMAAVHMARFFVRNWIEFGIPANLYYWKSAKGNEVDFVIFLDGKPFGIEVKYQNIISPWDEMSIRKGIGRGIIVTKDVFKYGEIPKIPLWAFLLIDTE